MTRADGREIRGEVAVDLIAKPDDDPGRQARLGFGDCRRESGAGTASQALEDIRRLGLRRPDLERTDAERARHAGSAEVITVWIVVRRRPDSPPDR